MISTFEIDSRLYFDKNLVCIGSMNQVPSFSGNYYASEYFCLPSDYNPIGLPSSEIEVASIAEIKRRESNNK
jgi:hypothetical protein